MTQSPAPGRRVRHLLSALGLAIRSRPDYLTCVLPERRHARQTETDHHRLDQGPGDTAQGDSGAAALACGNGIGGGGYSRGRTAEGEARLCTHPAERRIRLPAI